MSSDHLQFPPGTHPLDQLHLWCNEVPCEAQLDIIRAWAKLRRVFATFPNSGGKTSIVLPTCIFSIMMAFRGAKCVVMGGSEGQLFGQLFKSMKSRLIAMDRRDMWEIKDGEKTITAWNGSWCQFVVPRDALRVEGFHGEWSHPEGHPDRHFMPMCYFTDESKGIPNDRMEDGVMRIEPDFLLAVTSPGYDGDHWTYKDMNPGELARVVEERTAKWGENPKRDAYEPDPRFVFDKGVWRYRRMIKPADLPHLRTPDRLKYRADMAQKHGKNSQWYRSMVMGEFALDGSENNIFMQRHLDLLVRSMNGDFKPKGGDVRAAADVSGGGDANVIGIREGTNVLMLRKIETSGQIETARELVRILREVGIEPWQFTIDGIGTGAGIAEIMEKMHGYVGISRFMSNNNPLQNFEYADRYTELHYWLKELLEYEVLRLPHSQALHDQMRDRLWAPRSQTGRYAGRIGCEPKEKYREKHSGRSPDELDTLVYLFSDFDIDGIRRGLPSKTERAVARVEERPSKMEIEAQGGAASGGAFSGLVRMPGLAELSCGVTRRT